MARMKKSKNPELPNRHQKLARRPGEHRVGSEQIAELLEFSLSDDAEERLEAAENLCPYHVRTRIDEVWDALYRMMQDDNVRVRKAAWHTLKTAATRKTIPVWMPSSSTPSNTRPTARSAASWRCLRRVIGSARTSC